MSWRFGEGEPTAAEREEVARELGGLRRLASRLRLDEVRAGTWFSRLVRQFLQTYAHEVDAAYFERTYPGRPVDEVVQERVRAAARRAGTEGALSAGAYTGAVAATIGSAATASAVTVPAALTSFVADLLFVSAGQLRLAHDIAVLRRVPLDLDDPEDLWTLIRAAFVIKGSEAGSTALGKGVPVVLRPVLQRLASDGTLAAARSLPAMGTFLLRRNVLKFSVPAVGVPLSAAVNHWSTRSAGAYADGVFGRQGRIVDAARAMTDRAHESTALLWVLWLVIKADSLVHENERLLLRHVATILDDPASELAALAALKRSASPWRDETWAPLVGVKGDLAALYDAGVVAAAVDGKINANELKVLRRLAQRCGVAYDERVVRDLATSFAAPG